MSGCVFGFDFGTMSCRGVAISLEDGRVLATAEKEYKNGVISERLPNGGAALPPEWFLQSPEDWLESMRCVSREMLAAGNIKPGEVLGLGTDFTNCTLLPVLKDGTPLCETDKYKDRPNAWPKLWKHHGAQKYAEQIGIDPGTVNRVYSYGGDEKHRQQYFLGRVFYTRLFIHLEFSF